MVWRVLSCENTTEIMAVSKTTGEEGKEQAQPMVCKELK
jgi:hypothetical protein